MIRKRTYTINYQIQTMKAATLLSFEKAKEEDFKIYSGKWILGIAKKR